MGGVHRHGDAVAHIRACECTGGAVAGEGDDVTVHHAGELIAVDVGVGGAVPHLVLGGEGNGQVCLVHVHGCGCGCGGDRLAILAVLLHQNAQVVVVSAVGVHIVSRGGVGGAGGAGDIGPLGRSLVPALPLIAQRPGVVAFHHGFEFIAVARLGGVGGACSHVGHGHGDLGALADNNAAKGLPDLVSVDVGVAEVDHVAVLYIAVIAAHLGLSGQGRAVRELKVEARGIGGAAKGGSHIAGVQTGHVGVEGHRSGGNDIRLKGVALSVMQEVAQILAAGEVILGDGLGLQLFDGQCPQAVGLARSLILEDHAIYLDIEVLAVVLTAIRSSKGLVAGQGHRGLRRVSGHDGPEGAVVEIVEHCLGSVCVLHLGIHAAVEGEENAGLIAGNGAAAPLGRVVVCSRCVVEELILTQDGQAVLVFFRSQDVAGRVVHLGGECVVHGVDTIQVSNRDHTVRHLMALILSEEEVESGLAGAGAGVVGVAVLGCDMDNHGVVLAGLELGVGPGDRVPDGTEVRRLGVTHIPVSGVGIGGAVLVAVLGLPGIGDAGGRGGNGFTQGGQLIEGHVHMGDVDLALRRGGRELHRHGGVLAVRGGGVLRRVEFSADLQIGVVVAGLTGELRAVHGSYRDSDPIGGVGLEGIRFIDRLPRISVPFLPDHGAVVGHIVAFFLSGDVVARGPVRLRTSDRGHVVVGHNDAVRLVRQDLTPVRLFALRRQSVVVTVGTAEGVVSEFAAAFAGARFRDRRPGDGGAHGRAAVRGSRDAAVQLQGHLVIVDQATVGAAHRRQSEVVDGVGVLVCGIAVIVLVKRVHHKVEGPLLDGLGVTVGFLAGVLVDDHHADVLAHIALVGIVGRTGSAGDGLPVTARVFLLPAVVVVAAVAGAHLSRQLVTVLGVTAVFVGDACGVLAVHAQLPHRGVDQVAVDVGVAGVDGLAVVGSAERGACVNVFIAVVNDAVSIAVEHVVDGCAVVSVSCRGGHCGRLGAGCHCRHLVRHSRAAVEGHGGGTGGGVEVCAARIAQSGRRRRGDAGGGQFVEDQLTHLGGSDARIHTTGCIKGVDRLAVEVGGVVTIEGRRDVLGKLVVTAVAVYINKQLEIGAGHSCGVAAGPDNGGGEVRRAHGEAKAHFVASCLVVVVLVSGTGLDVVDQRAAGIGQGPDRIGLGGEGVGDDHLALALAHDGGVLPVDGGLVVAAVLCREDVGIKGVAGGGFCGNDNGILAATHKGSGKGRFAACRCALVPFDVAGGEAAQRRAGGDGRVVRGSSVSRSGHVHMDPVNLLVLRREDHTEDDALVVVVDQSGFGARSRHSGGPVISIAGGIKLPVAGGGQHHGGGVGLACREGGGVPVGLHGNCFIREYSTNALVVANYFACCNGSLCFCGGLGRAGSGYRHIGGSNQFVRCADGHGGGAGQEARVAGGKGEGVAHAARLPLVRCHGPGAVGGCAAGGGLFVKVILGDLHAVGTVALDGQVVAAQFADVEAVAGEYHQAAGDRKALCDLGDGLHHFNGEAGLCAAACRGGGHFDGVGVAAAALIGGGAGEGTIALQGQSAAGQVAGTGDRVGDLSFTAHGLDHFAQAVIVGHGEGAAGQAQGQGRPLGGEGHRRSAHGEALTGLVGSAAVAPAGEGVAGLLEVAPRLDIDGVAHEVEHIVCGNCTAVPIRCAVGDLMSLFVDSHELLLLGHGEGVVRICRHLGTFRGVRMPGGKFVTAVVACRQCHGLTGHIVGVAGGGGTCKRGACLGQDLIEVHRRFLAVVVDQLTGEVTVDHYLIDLAGFQGVGSVSACIGPVCRHIAAAGGAERPQGHAGHVAGGRRANHRIQIGDDGAGEGVGSGHVEDQVYGGVLGVGGVIDGDGSGIGTSVRRLARHRSDLVGPGLARSKRIGVAGICPRQFEAAAGCDGQGAGGLVAGVGDGEALLGHARVPLLRLEGQGFGIHCDAPCLVHRCRRDLARRTVVDLVISAVVPVGGRCPRGIVGDGHILPGSGKGAAAHADCALASVGGVDCRGGAGAAENDVAVCPAGSGIVGSVDCHAIRGRVERGSFHRAGDAGDGNYRCRLVHGQRQVHRGGGCAVVGMGCCNRDALCRHFVGSAGDDAGGFVKCQAAGQGAGCDLVRQGDAGVLRAEESAGVVGVLCAVGGGEPGLVVRVDQCGVLPHRVELDGVFVIRLQAAASIQSDGEFAACLILSCAVIGSAPAGEGVARSGGNGGGDGDLIAIVVALGISGQVGNAVITRSCQVLHAVGAGEVGSVVDLSADGEGVLAGGADGAIALVVVRPAVEAVALRISGSFDGHLGAALIDPRALEGGGDAVGICLQAHGVEIHGDIGVGLAQGGGHRNRLIGTAIAVQIHGDGIGVADQEVLEGGCAAGGGLSQTVTRGQGHGGAILGGTVYIDRHTALEHGGVSDGQLDGYGPGLAALFRDHQVHLIGAGSGDLLLAVLAEHYLDGLAAMGIHHTGSIRCKREVAGIIGIALLLQRIGHSLGRGLAAVAEGTGVNGGTCSQFIDRRSYFALQRVQTQDRDALGLGGHRDGRSAAAGREGEGTRGLNGACATSQGLHRPAVLSIAGAGVGGDDDGVLTAGGKGIAAAQFHGLAVLGHHHTADAGVLVHYDGILALGKGIAGGPRHFQVIRISGDLLVFDADRGTVTARWERSVGDQLVGVACGPILTAGDIRDSRGDGAVLVVSPTDDIRSVARLLDGEVSDGSTGCQACDGNGHICSRSLSGIANGKAGDLSALRRCAHRSAATVCSQRQDRDRLEGGGQGHILRDVGKICGSFICCAQGSACGGPLLEAVTLACVGREAGEGSACAGDSDSLGRSAVCLTVHPYAAASTWVDHQGDGMGGCNDGEGGGNSRFVISVELRSAVLGCSRRAVALDFHRKFGPRFHAAGWDGVCGTVCIRDRLLGPIRILPIPGIGNIAAAKCRAILVVCQCRHTEGSTWLSCGYHAGDVASGMSLAVTQLNAGKPGHGICGGDYDRSLLCLSVGTCHGHCEDAGFVCLIQAQAQRLKLCICHGQGDGLIAVWRLTDGIVRVWRQGLSADAVCDGRDLLQGNVSSHRDRSGEAVCAAYGRRYFFFIEVPDKCAGGAAQAAHFNGLKLGPHLRGTGDGHCSLYTRGRTAGCRTDRSAGRGSRLLGVPGGLPGISALRGRDKVYCSLGLRDDRCGFSIECHRGAGGGSQGDGVEVHRGRGVGFADTCVLGLYAVYIDTVIGGIHIGAGVSIGAIVVISELDIRCRLSTVGVEGYGAGGSRGTAVQLDGDGTTIDGLSKAGGHSSLGRNVDGGRLCVAGRTGTGHRPAAELVIFVRRSGKVYRLTGRNVDLLAVGRLPGLAGVGAVSCLDGTAGGRLGLDGIEICCKIRGRARDASHILVYDGLSALLHLDVDRVGPTGEVGVAVCAVAVVGQFAAVSGNGEGVARVCPRLAV